MIRFFTYSLSLRLLAIFLLVAGLAVFGVIEGVRWAYRTDDLRALVSGHLALHVDYVRQDIGAPPRLERALAITRRVPVDIHIEGPGLRWSSDPRFPDPARLQFGPSEYFSDRPSALVGPLEGVDFATYDNHNYLRFNEGAYQITVVTPKIATQNARPALLPILLGFALLLIVAAYLAVRWLFHPLEEIRQGAAYVGAGHFEHRIAVRREDELGALADDINAMANNVQQMLDAKRQLLLGVSHELRSPLSRMRLSLELLEDSAAAGSLRQDVGEMRAITETLLQAEQLGTRHAALERRAVSLTDLVDELRADFFADEPRLRTQVSGLDSAQLDRARILLMLKNLVGNALRYSSAVHGPVELTVVGKGALVEFSVRDYGPGIPREQRAHVGEPFFRPDASRARSTGGAGLGLYLARQVARAHGGDLKLLDCDGPGALFVATVPTA
ncbi:MAG: HAMP domain-containing protein [Proteobacteria bacterium]|nr:HAMP domain-containing protein [Pseudomonadota bacterium]